jgi:hypothetical protein
MSVAYWDLESRSAINLRDSGAYIYSIDATTEVLCLVYAIDYGESRLWLPTDPVPEVFLQIAADPKGWRLIAHNYGFERAMLTTSLFRGTALGQSRWKCMRARNDSLWPMPIPPNSVSWRKQSVCLTGRIRRRERRCWRCRVRKRSVSARPRPFRPGTKIRPNCSCSMSAASSTSLLRAQPGSRRS